LGNLDSVPDGADDLCRSHEGIALHSKMVPRSSKRVLQPSVKELDEKIFSFILRNCGVKSVSFFEVNEYVQKEFCINPVNHLQKCSFTNRVHLSVNRLERKKRIYTVDGTVTLFMANPFSEIIEIAKKGA
jgi:hypothetical protein